MPADSEPILVEVIIIRISLRRMTDTMILSNDDDNVRETIEIQKMFLVPSSGKCKRGGVRSKEAETFENYKTAGVWHLMRILIV